MDTRLRGTAPSLELQRTAIRQTLVQALAIIKPFDEPKDFPAGLVPVYDTSADGPIRSSGAEEALRHGIVIAVAFAAHARLAKGGELLLKGQAAVLRTLIRVMNEPRVDGPLSHGHGKRIERQLLIRLGTHGPADHPPGIQIQEHGDYSHPARVGTAVKSPTQTG